MALTKEEAVKNLRIESVEVFRNEICPHGAIRVEWSGSAGFGQYDFVFDRDGKIHGYSERMESTEDKYFSKELFRLLHERLIVEA